jgi:hypothetical protein
MALLATGCLGLAAPPPPNGRLDPVAANRGAMAFVKAGGCATCHASTSLYGCSGN